MIQHKATNEATKVVRRILEKLNVSIYNEKSKRFSTHNCNTYCSSNREVQVTLITTKEELPNKEQFIAEVQNRCQRLNQLCKM